jgi:type IV pilus assembly protein PilX
VSALRQMPPSIARQRGVSLFFALVCLVSVMLAAVALVRSVDTSTLIAGNLAFQQSATNSSDSGTEAAITWLATIEAANSAKDVRKDSTHAFNQSNATVGYYSAIDESKSLTAASGTRFLWNDTDSKGLAKDSSGNTTRYVIQRMCRTENVPVKDANCLFGSIAPDTGSQNIKLPQQYCDGDGCPYRYQLPQLRITSRTEGPRNTLSYIQVFVY